MTKERVFVFIYEKDGKIQAYGLKDATEIHDKLKSEGWNHKHTIDACCWLEYMHNRCDVSDYQNEVESLG